jgi:hypothetical protein
MNLNDITTLPVSQNFSDMPQPQNAQDLMGSNGEPLNLPGYEIDWSEVFIEDAILNMLKCLKYDRERVILLLMIMGKDGYDFKHKDVATVFQVEYSWYMRIVRRVRNRLIGDLDKKSSNSDRSSQKRARFVKNVAKKH